MSSCGLCTIKLVDPLSTITNILMEDEISAVGFYYDGKFVKLFNTYDNNPTSIFKNGTDLDTLASSKYVLDIILYPLDNECIGRCELFKISALQILECNKATNKIDNYKRLLLQYASREKIHRNIRTGYTIVNNIVTLLKTTASLKFGMDMDKLPAVSNKKLEIVSNEVRLEKKENFSFNNEQQLLDVQADFEKLCTAGFQLLISDSSFFSKLISRSTTAMDIGSLNSMYINLNSLIEKVELGNTPVINLDDLVNNYNQLALVAKSEDAPKIEINSENSGISKIAAVITRTDIDKKKDCVLTPGSGKTQLRQLSEAELYGALLYIESLRTVNGNHDCKYAGLQNRISAELAIRQKKGLTNTD